MHIKNIRNILGAFKSLITVLVTVITMIYQNWINVCIMSFQREKKTNLVTLMELW